MKACTRSSSGTAGAPAPQSALMGNAVSAATEPAGRASRSCGTLNTASRTALS